MVKLLIIADDFTGALDTGVQFAAAGAGTRVLTGELPDCSRLSGEIEVLVLNAETRHLSGGEAYAIVYRAVRRAKEAGVPCIYKKTDSALRGNIGAELAAVYDAGGEKRLHFLPAFPQMGRTTRNAVHYIDGIPVNESVFGKDPFEPVKHASVLEIIAEQTAIVQHPMGASLMNDEALPEGILVYDSENVHQMRNIAKCLQERNELICCAGCAGFASVLAGLLGLCGTQPKLPVLTPRLLVACGSVNPITVAQLDEAEAKGVTRIRLTAEQKLDPAWYRSAEAKMLISEWHQGCEREGILILDSNDPPESLETRDYVFEHNITLKELRLAISRTIGHIVKDLLDDGLNATMMITGGDTLLGFMQYIGVTELEPICEIEQGAVLFAFRYKECSYHVISKSGGFGKTSFLKDLHQKLLIMQEEKINAEAI
ncbi:MAG: four-carbon acid sugar kinase family protein [Eubacteriales bacterium]|nr:four-carbon acid sugar kinase family protein [Eubacteriales bacterium]